MNHTAAIFLYLFVLSANLLILLLLFFNIKMNEEAWKGKLQDRYTDEQGKNQELS